MNDKVKHPQHYTKGNIECIQAIKESMTSECYKGYLKGNCIKYLWRYEDKNGVEDLKKAKVYLSWLIKELEETQSNPEEFTEQILRNIENATK